MAGVRSLFRGSVAKGYASAASAPIRVDSTNNVVMVNVAGSGSTEKTLVDTDSTQTLTNKTLNAPTSLVDGMAGTSITNLADATKKVQFDLSTLTTAHTTTFQVPDVNGTDTIVTVAAAQTLTSKTLTTPVIATISGNTSAAGSITSADATTPSLATATGKTNTGNVTINGKTSGSFVLSTADSTAQAVTVKPAAQTVGATTLTIPDQAGASSNFVFDTLAQTLTNKTLTAPVIGVATGTSLAVTGAITSSSPSAKIGYATGAGGTQTQATNKSTGFTLSALCGTITFNNAALAADTTVASTWTNTSIAATDVVLMWHISGGTIGAYTFGVTPGAGSATVSLHNCTPGSLSEAVVAGFVVFKGVAA